MLGITRRERMKYEEIREETKVKDVLEIARSLKRKWVGHFMGREDRRWTTRATFWIPRDSKRQRERERKRLRDELPYVMGAKDTKSRGVASGGGQVPAPWMIKAYFIFRLRFNNYPQHSKS